MQAGLRRGCWNGGWRNGPSLTQGTGFFRGNPVEGSLHLQLAPLWGQSCPGSLHPQSDSCPARKIFRLLCLGLLWVLMGVGVLQGPQMSQLWVGGAEPGMGT